MIDSKEITSIPAAPKKFAPDWLAILERGVEGLPEEKKDMQPDFNEIIKRGVILAESSAETVSHGDVERVNRLIQHGLTLEKDIKSTREQIEKLDVEIERLSSRVPAIKAFEETAPENGVYLQLKKYWGDDDLSQAQKELMALHVEKEKLTEQLLRSQEEMRRWKSQSAAGQ